LRGGSTTFALPTDDPSTTEGLLAFVAYELRNSYEMIGKQLDTATSADEAKDAVRLFM
jgi:hypothetical protein